MTTSEEMELESRLYDTAFMAVCRLWVQQPT
eukprot:CAMPEP_0174373646 /NCGR_PEP_ID=MMETSP0811_2-20130205/107994_1 /TAXON_ID=73025 ORGANISM="Eutreptiella gymnastica-like, Strain CCMP1594" /NCGR_SAMPLE_ID=MMETSP0811_2 /ASSEMBLY_ACC=CAM_ASM_000667 /LENGTH=30 /DNA_ID= /DNA_START= /DNA_END= /DNA_ORIENTATION=